MATMGQIISMSGDLHIDNSTSALMLNIDIGGYFGAGHRHV